MRRSTRAFPGLGIDCESTLVDAKQRRVAATVPTNASDLWHCVALWSCTVHSYFVRIENEADEPLFYLEHGSRVVVKELLVEPPLKRHLDKLKPGFGRSSKSFAISARVQDQSAGLVGTAELRSDLCAQSIVENGAAVPVALPDEQAYRGRVIARCTLE